MKLSHTCLCLVLLAGCSRSPRATSTSQTGDVGRFILQRVEHYGGRAGNTNGLTRLEAHWNEEVITGAEYLDGREQLSIRMPGDKFQQVTDYLAHAYGIPFQQATSTPAGALHGYYTQSNIGVAIQFYRDEKETGLILVGVPKR